MHLGNGQVTAGCAVFGMALAAAGWSAAMLLKRFAGESKERSPARFGAAVAAVFALQAINVTVIPAAMGGVSGHVVGSFLLARWFGVRRALLGITMVLLLQSMPFGDGGWATFGLNVLNMGVLPCLVVYPLWACFGKGASGAGKWLRLGAGAWAATFVAAMACGVELASVTGLNGRWMSLLGTMAGVHALIGLLEAGVTVGAVAAVEAFPASLGQKSWRADAGAGAAALVLAGLGATGASPWPDGLQHALALHGVRDIATGLMGSIARAQATVTPFGSYTAVGTMLGAMFAGFIAAGMVGAVRSIPIAQGVRGV